MSSRFFGQLYIIHAWINGTMIPCAWVLMANRSAADYNLIFFILYSTIKGCHFHFGQSLWKNFSKFAALENYMKMGMLVVKNGSTMSFVWH